jgi:ABC-type dipeptide/oligopeptide/nickel transport system permease component
MLAYLVRRLLYAVPIIVGIVGITFALFFVVNTPDDMARRILGDKADTPEIVERWKREHNYHLPLFYNDSTRGAARFTDTLLFQKCGRLLAFDLGRSDVTDRPIAAEIRRRMGPSLAIALPTFTLGMMVNISTALIIAFCRGTYLDRWGTIVCVLMMSISSLFYIIGGQFFFAQWLRLFPISGFDWGSATPKFLVLPVVIGTIAGIGGGVRYYRTVILEEVGRDYVRTARAKGLGEGAVLFRHVLKNAMIPILTNAVMAIPFLFVGSLIMESFFAIPGLGSMTITAIHAQDFAVVRSMVYIGAILYIIGLLLTDISYTLVDPRISLGAGDTRSLYASPSPADVGRLLAAVLALAIAAGGVYWLLSWLVRQPAVENSRVPLLTNGALLLTVAGVLAFWLRARRHELWRNAWREVRRNRLAMGALGVLLAFIATGCLDSISWRDVERTPEGADRLTADGRPVLAPPLSVLDRLCTRLRVSEKSYSAPLATHLLTKETIEEEVDGQMTVRRVHQPLQYPRRHLLGTDKTGQDVLYKSLKSIRTGLIIGGLTTLIAIPLAIALGVLAGFFGGWIDDAVQYLYSTLSSVPWVLLVVSFILVFGQGLVQLCIVMGLTGWIGLCRVLRGETLKLREREYVQAALALGVSKLRVIWRHVVPNLMHLVLITVVLRFSGLVLAEAVLSYIGVGVGPDTFSWGSMIDQARGEMGRDPLVWWSLAAAFVAMFGLVLSANLFGDALRDALDPRLRTREELS